MDTQDIIEKYDPEDFPSRIAFARFLAANHPEKTTKGWEMHLIKTEYQNSVPYTYDETDDTYYLIFGEVAHTLDGDEHKSILHDYTSGVKVSEIAGKHNKTTDFIHRWRRTFGVTRSSPAITTNEIITNSEDDIASAIISRKMYASQIKAAKKERAALADAAERWMNLDREVLTHMRGNLTKAPKTVPRLKLKKTSRPYALVVCPTDFHWGKHGWVDEVGETYNFEEARKRLFEKTQSLIERIPVSPEKIFVGAGSDWFHVDNDAGTTTKGTPQDMCGSPAEILVTGCRLAREHIDLLRQVAPVEIVMMAGNHDRHSTIALMMYLSAAYEDVEDVTIAISPNNRRYITYGDTLLGFTHGDGLSRKTNMAGLMAVEAREQWGLTAHKVWFHGHLHHQRLTEGDGCLIVQMPSLAGHDRYHARSGYTTSTAGLAAYLIDKEEGYIGSLFAPVTHED